MDLSRFPRKLYTNYETPIEAMPRLSAALGGKVNLWIKRDDKLGLTGGGNKTRKLEFAMADALAKGADCVITCGAVQSNHCRLTLAAAVKEGLGCYLVLEERVPDSYKPEASGNNYLYKLLGAKRIIRVDLGTLKPSVEQLRETLVAEGKNPYVIPGGSSDEIGSTGYAACAQEIVNQQFRLQLPRFHSLVTATGSGGTHSGLVVGLSALRSPMPVIGISTRHPRAKQVAHIRQLSNRLAAHIGVPMPRLEDVIVFDEYVGDGYSLPTDGMKEAVTLFARHEGILLDPVYSGKGAAGLIDLVRKGKFPEGSDVLFLHTGGAPTLYHYQPIAKL